MVFVIQIVRHLVVSRRRAFCPSSWGIWLAVIQTLLRVVIPIVVVLCPWRLLCRRFVFQYLLQGCCFLPNRLYSIRCRMGGRLRARQLPTRCLSLGSLRGRGSRSRLRSRWSQNVSFRFWV